MRRTRFCLPLVLILLLPACSQSIETYTAVYPSATPKPSPTPSATFPALMNPTETGEGLSTPTPVPTPGTVSVWIDPAIPQAYRSGIDLPTNLILSDSDQAEILITIDADNGFDAWVYVAAAAFPSLRDSITSEALKALWDGELPEDQTEIPLVLSQETERSFSAWWGPPSPGTVTVLPVEELISSLWQERDGIAILPFEALEPRWKVLQVDGQTPFDKNFILDQYPLALPISIEMNPDFETDFDIELQSLATSNFNTARLSSVALTGVTALVRGTAITMDSKGITYPAEDILPWLVNADILHINNEIPFFTGCPPPELYPSEIRFCSSPSYVELLTYIGTDIIELSGDHFGDYGIDAMLETIALYQDLDIPFYGGGQNSLDAREAVRIEHNGNRFAFIGCNAKGIAYYAGATESSPGAVACDFEWLTAEIHRLAEAGNIVITTFQHNEYYTYQAQPDLVRDFQSVADAGAVIVSGSQAHQPHGMAFYNDSFLHYGLGNLFFDQYRFFPGKELDRAFIDMHFFYEGRHISTQLVTIHFIDLARSRLASPEEREIFLRQIFAASGW